jgi:subtilisin family serine protease
MYQAAACRLMQFIPDYSLPHMSIVSFIRRTALSGSAWLLAACVAAALPATAKSAAPDAAVQGEMLVRLRGTADLQPLLVKYSLSLRAQFGARPIYRLSAVGATSVESILAALALEPAVLSAEANRVHSTPEARRNSFWAIGSATSYADQWAPAALRLPQAHAVSQGTGVRVAVLDTGIDATHPVFAGRLLPGFDFVDFDHDPSEVESTGSPAFGHGTHVAGLVALAAPAAKIMPLRVLDAQGAGNAWVLAEAMLYAVDPDANPATDDGAHVINMSLGSVDRTQLFDAMVRIAGCDLTALTDPLGGFTDPGYNGDRQRCGAFDGAVVIAAAGNDASKQVRQYPAAEGAYALLPVTASTEDGRLAAFANFGSWVDVAAPGDGITSAVPGARFATWSGTSMAAPLTAGVAALVRSHEPDLSPRDVVRRIERNTAPLCGTNAQRRIDAVAALGAGPAPTTCR